MLKESVLSRSQAEAKEMTFGMFFLTVFLFLIIRKELKAHEWGLRGSVAVELLSR